MKRELDEMREHALEPATRENFRRSEAVVRRQEREHPTTLDGMLDWIEQIRRAFGDMPVEREPWRGSDFRL